MTNLPGDRRRISEIGNTARTLLPLPWLLSCIAVVALAGCESDVQGDDTTARSADATLSRGDSIVNAMNAPMTYVDSLQAAVNGTLIRAPVPRRDSQAGLRAGAPSTGSGGARTVPAPSAVAARPTDGRSYVPSNSSASVSGDTVRGVVALIGSAPATRLVLKSNGGRATISLSGMATDGLRSLVGLDVLVRGVKVTERDVVVASFIVRNADDIPVWDGVLEQSGGAFQLKLTDGGVKRLAQVPTGLRDAVGKRVWVAMNDGTTAVHSFGRIERH